MVPPRCRRQLRDGALRRAPRSREAKWLIAGLASATLAGVGGLSTVKARTTTPRALPTQPAVGEQVVTFVDPRRLIRRPGHRSEPRRLVTVIRYPLGAGGPVPLIVFGHGFAVTPATYSRLLDAWARAGYVVAAPVFPLSNAHAPGGPTRADRFNQPWDMTVVISRMIGLSARPRGTFAHLIDSRQIAVAGQSDGAETAFATAFERHYLDTRVRAAMVFSGAEMPGGGGLTHSTPSPALLAVQGTADRINAPQYTLRLFSHSRRPKYLLKLLGAGHLPPYTGEQPQLSIVERASVAFLDRYLEHRPGAGRQLIAAGEVPHEAVLDAAP